MAAGIRIYPDGTIGWTGAPLDSRSGHPGQRGGLGQRLELRGATTEPPKLDIGADILNLERKPAEPARITIIRQSEQDAGFREIYVSLDGTKLVMLQYGESYTCEVKPGPHTLRAHNTMCWKTHQIMLRPGEHAKFTAINRTGMFSRGLLFMLGAFPVYLTFERELDKSQVPNPNTHIKNVG